MMPPSWAASAAAFAVCRPLSGVLGKAEASTAMAGFSSAVFSDALILEASRKQQTETPIQSCRSRRHSALFVGHA